jgi:hypothetical protein
VIKKNSNSITSKAQEYALFCERTRTCSSFQNKIHGRALHSDSCIPGDYTVGCQGIFLPEEFSFPETNLSRAVHRGQDCAVECLSRKRSYQYVRGESGERGYEEKPSRNVLGTSSKGEL